MDDWLLIGTRNGLGNRYEVTPELFGITHHDRLRHLYCIGKTGTGKTTLLHNLVIQDIEAGRGLALLDPHGDFSETLLNHIPAHRVNDVIYFSPADAEYPIGINFLAQVKPEQRDLATEHIVSVFKHIWDLDEVTTPRLLNLLRNTVSALLEKQGTTLLGIYRMLIDDRYRDTIVRSVTDSHTRLYWEEEFSSYDARERRQVIDSTLNKVGLLQSSTIVRNCIGQVKNRLDFKKITDNNKILICNLSKGLLGEQGSKLLGSLISIQIYLTIMQRAELSESKRIPFYLYVDEFQNFGTAVFENILSESRKYRLSLTLAHQFMSQLDRPIRDSVLGNVGSIISFQAGSADGEDLAKEFSEAGNVMQSYAFSDLDPFEIQARLHQDNKLQSPFIGKTLPPFQKNYNYRYSVIRHSRDRYALPRGRVEKNIDTWLFQED